MFTCSSCSWIVFYFLLSLLEIAATTWLVDVDTACFFHSHCLVGLDVSTFPSVQRGVRSDELYLLDIRNEASFSRNPSNLWLFQGFQGLTTVFPGLFMPN